MVAEKRQLLFVMGGLESRYFFHSIPESDFLDDENNNDNNGVRELGEPILKLSNEEFPPGVSFISMGTKIYIIGGIRYDDILEDKVYPEGGLSKRVFIYDVLSNSISPGPFMSAGKSCPILLSVASKIYALNQCFSDHQKSLRDTKPPLFEVLDTNTGYSSPLPVPKIGRDRHRRRLPCVYSITSWAVYGSWILISVYEEGTFAYDTAPVSSNEETRLWKQVSDLMLPFMGLAQNLGNSIHVMYGMESESCGVGTYRLKYDDDKDGGGVSFKKIMGIDATPEFNLPKEVRWQELYLVPSGDESNCNKMYGVFPGCVDGETPWGCWYDEGLYPRDCYVEAGAFEFDIAKRVPKKRKTETQEQEEEEVPSMSCLGKRMTYHVGQVLISKLEAVFSFPMCASSASLQSERPMKKAGTDQESGEQLTTESEQVQESHQHAFAQREAEICTQIQGLKSSNEELKEELKSSYEHLRNEIDRLKVDTLERENKFRQKIMQMLRSQK